MSQVSVIIANYNREQLLGQTIDNLLRQSLPPHEIIVVDDGSTDDSVAVARAFGPAIRLVKQSNQGPGAARNAGLKLATGDYVQFQDSDDLLSLNKLAAQSQALDTTGADICLGPWAHTIIEGTRLRLQTCVLQQQPPPECLSLRDWLLRGWFTVFQSLLFRRSFLFQQRGYETDVRYGEDMEYFFRLLQQDPKITFAGDMLTFYRVNSGNNLSDEGGAPHPQRVIDWARCLVRIATAAQQMSPEVKICSRVAFFARLRKHQRYLLAVSNAPRELVETTARLMTAVPVWQLAGMELWQRLLERWRLVHTGQRWMRGLAAGQITTRQAVLIAELGFTVSST